MKITLSKSQWENIGKKAGWMKEAKEKAVIFYQTDGDGIFAIARDENTAFSLFKKQRWDFEVNGIKYKKDDWRGREAMEKLFGETMRVYMSNTKKTKIAGEDWLVNKDFTNQVILELTNMGDDILSSNDYSVTINHKIGNKTLKGLIIKVFEGSYEHDFILQAFNQSKMLTMSDGKSVAEAIKNMDLVLEDIISNI